MSVGTRTRSCRTRYALRLTVAALATLLAGAAGDGRAQPPEDPVEAEPIAVTAAGGVLQGLSGVWLRDEEASANSSSVIRELQERMRSARAAMGPRGDSLRRGGSEGGGGRPGGPPDLAAEAGGGAGGMGSRGGQMVGGRGGGVRFGGENKAGPPPPPIMAAPSSRLLIAQVGPILEIEDDQGRVQRVWVEDSPAGQMAAGGEGSEPIAAIWREGGLVTVTPLGAVGQARREYQLSADGARLDLVTTFTFGAAGDSLVLASVYRRR